LAVTTGQKTVLVLRVVGADASAPVATELSDSIFGTSGDIVNLASGYNDCSYGQLKFGPVQYNKVGTGSSAGVYQVTITNTIAGASDSTIRSAALTKAQTDLGVSSLSSVAHHTMMCLPTGTTGGWIAYVSMT
jgi:hypothetical protein